MNLVPLPRRVTPGDGRVSLADAWKLDAPDDLAGLECLTDLTFLNPSADKTLRLRLDEGIAGEEAYRLDLAPERIELSAATRTGIIRGVQTLRQLEREGEFDACVIEDAPALPIRAFHVDFRPKSYRLEYLLHTIDRLAELKYNFLLVEWENKYPYTRRPEVVHPEALTPDELAELKRRCAKYAIEIMPLVQTFGHLEFALTPEENSPLREVADDPAEICPLKPDAVAFVKSLVRDIIDGHAESRFIHLGSDETYRLGTCPACRANCEKVGRSAHFINHMKKIARVVLDAGKIPVMWNDMLIHHPDAIDMLPEEMVMLDWHYHTFGVWCDEMDAWWHPDRKLTADNFDRAPELHRTNYRSYYVGHHPTDAKKLRSFPYTKYFMDRGFRVIAGPSSCCHGDPGTNPNMAARAANTWGFAASAAMDGALGCALTSWQVRRHPWEVQWYCVALCAETSWHPFEGVREDFDARFMRSEYGVDDPSVPRSFCALDRPISEDRLDHYGGYNITGRMWSGLPTVERLRTMDEKGELSEDAAPTATAAETTRRAKEALTVFKTFAEQARRNVLDARFWGLAAEETIFRVELFDVLRRVYLARKEGAAVDTEAVARVVAGGDALYARAGKLWEKLLPPQTLNEEIFIRWDDVRSYLSGEGAVGC